MSAGLTSSAHALVGFRAWHSTPNMLLSCCVLTYVHPFVAYRGKRPCSTMTPTHRPPTSVSMTCMLPLVGLLPLHIFGHTSECVACPSKHEESLSGPADGSVEDVERSTIGSGESLCLSSGNLYRSRHWLAPVWKGTRCGLHLSPHLHGCHSLLQIPRGAANLAQG